VRLVFYGTRVPIKTLFDSLAVGQTLEEFLDDFERVSREQAEAALELAGSHLLDDLPKPSRFCSITIVLAVFATTCQVTTST
jgi:uncharacterized protein (DUF433 family)